jgi:hypothetical protein
MATSMLATLPLISGKPVWGRTVDDCFWEKIKSANAACVRLQLNI